MAKKKTIRIRQVRSSIGTKPGHRETLRGPAGKDGVDGRDGIDGRDGNNGRDGRNGSAGIDGVGIALVEQRDDKSFWITLTDGQETQIELPVAKPSGFFGV